MHQILCESQTDDTETLVKIRQMFDELSSGQIFISYAPFKTGLISADDNDYTVSPLTLTAPQNVADVQPLRR